VSWLPTTLIGMSLLISGCDRLPESLSDCADLACQQRWLTATMDDKPGDALEAIKALPAGMDRETLIQVMMVEWPEHSAPLCDVLSSGQVKVRCESLTERPHLWQVDAAAPESGAVGAGAAYPVLSVDMPPAQHPWNELAPMEVECTDTWTQNTCIGQQAVDWTYKSKHKDAWLICLGADQDKWRYECFFQISEATYNPIKGGGIPGLAAEMCLYSGFYQDRCLGHLAGKIGRWAPAATWDDPQRWRDVERAIHQVQQTLQTYSPALGSRWTALTWAYAMDAAYAQVERPVGNPIDNVGFPAMPHIAASVAWSLWLAESHRAQSLDAWLDAFNAAMERREVDPGPQPKLEEENELTKSWSDTLPGEEAIEWTVYRGPMARRAIGKDPRGDALICILEAAARNPSPHRASLFREALQYPDPLVRWTAARLAAQRLPDVMRDVDPSIETDLLVRARLDQGLAMRDD